MTEKQTAHIDDWYLVDLWPIGSGQSLIGQVSKHPQQDSFKTKAQQTSMVVNLDLSAKTAETENTIYTLGTPRKAY